MKLSAQTLPHNWEVVRLGDVCKTTSGGTPSRDAQEYYGGDIPWLKSGELNDGKVSHVEEKITQLGIEKSSAKVFARGTLLVAMYGATVGKLGILDLDAATNQAVCAIFPNATVFRDYLFYCLLYQRNNLLEQTSGGAQPNISQEIIREQLIPLPPLNEQRRIAAILEAADHERRRRHTAMELSDKFLQDVFVQMFGDPVTNPMGWDIDSLDSVTTKITDGEHLNPVFEATGFPIVMANQVLDNGVDFSETKYVSARDYNKFSKKCDPQADDILLVSRGATIGRLCVINTKVKFCLMGSVILMKPNHTTVEPRFLREMMRYQTYQALLKNTSGSSAQEAIYLADLRSKSVIKPPLELQRNFAIIAAAHEAIYSKQQESARQGEHLFQTLLHRAFNGEL